MSVIVDALGLGRQQEQRQALVALLDVAVGAREQQDVVGDVGGGAPRLVAVDHPAALVALGERAHAAEQVGAAARLGEADREARLALDDRGRKRSFCSSRAVEPDRLRAGERGQPPDPGQPGERAREPAGEQHLHEDVAALAAVLLGDRDPVEAGLGELVPQLERILVLSVSRSRARSPSAPRCRPTRGPCR